MAVSTRGKSGASCGIGARDAMLHALLDGTWRPAGELARAAGIGTAAAATQLDALVAAGVLTTRGGGRWAYYGLAALTRAPRQAASLPSAAAIPSPTRDTALREARTCYGHLAGRLGVALCAAWTERGWLDMDVGVIRLSPAAADALVAAGWSAAAARQLLALRGRPCVDWTERRIHLGGALGKSITRRMVAQGWLRRVEGRRTVARTPAGARGLTMLGVRLPRDR